MIMMMIMDDDNKRLLALLQKKRLDERFPFLTIGIADVYCIKN